MDQKIPEPLSKPVEPTKPGANVAPEQAHAAMATSTPMGTPAANVGKSGRGKSLLIGFIILLLAAGCASMGYMLWKAQKDIDILNADHKAALEEMDKKRAEIEAQIKEMDGGETQSSDDYLVIEEMGVKFKLPDTVKDLEYYYDKDLSRAYFGSKSLTAEAEKSNAETCYVKSGPLGEIEKKSTAYPENRNKPVESDIKTIEGSYYGFMTPDVGCPGGGVANSTELQELADSQLDAVHKAFQSLEKQE